MVAGAGWVAVSAKDTRSATVRPGFEFLNRKFILSSGCRFVEFPRLGGTPRPHPSSIYSAGSKRVPGSNRLEPSGKGLSSAFPRRMPRSLLGRRLCGNHLEHLPGVHVYRDPDPRRLLVPDGRKGLLEEPV